MVSSSSDADSPPARSVRPQPAKRAPPKPIKKPERKPVGKSWETSLQSDRLADKLADAGWVGVEGEIERQKRQRLQSDTKPFQRGIIRHLVLVLDLTAVMAEKDMRPNRLLVQIGYATEFVGQFFEQNPISQLAIVGMHDGIAVILSDLSGNVDDHVANLAAVRQGTILSGPSAAPVVAAATTVPREPKGSPSLQNALEMARALLFHTPVHGTRETVIVLGALLSVDPGDIHDTVRACVRDRIRVSIVGLGARIKVCTEICEMTNGGDGGTYDVARDAWDFRDLILKATTPPLIRKNTRNGADDDGTALLLMGFPSRTMVGSGPAAASTVAIPLSAAAEENVGRVPTLCVCHGTLSRHGYACPRCEAKVCSLPVACPTCGLTLVLSTHLARGYGHLFPLANFRAVSWQQAARRMIRPKSKPGSGVCVSCLAVLPEIPDDIMNEERRRKKDDDPDEADADVDVDVDGSDKHKNAAANPGSDKPKQPDKNKDDGTGPLEASESSRYECRRCHSIFCVDCDVFCHRVLHNCPGCLGLQAA